MERVVGLVMSVGNDDCCWWAAAEAWTIILVARRTKRAAAWNCMVHNKQISVVVSAQELVRVINKGKAKRNINTYYKLHYACRANGFDAFAGNNKAL